MLLAARCRAALLVLHVFFYYVSMLSIFHNSNGAARCCWLHAVVLRCWFCYVSMLNIFHNSNGAARCCWLHAVVLRCWFCMFVLIMLVCSVYFTIPTGQRDAVGCTLSCCA